MKMPKYEHSNCTRTQIERELKFTKTQIVRKLKLYEISKSEKAPSCEKPPGGKSGAVKKLGLPAVLTLRKSEQRL